jgi:hypothetical protein
MGYLGVFYNLHKAYLGRHLGAYLGYGIPKDYLKGYIKPICEVI